MMTHTIQIHLREFSTYVQLEEQHIIEAIEGWNLLDERIKKKVLKELGLR